MSNITHVRAKSSLKKLGFQTDLKHRQIDSRFLKALDEARRKQVEDIWHGKEVGLTDGLEIYEMPRTIKEAALLFSHDWRRSVASNAWALESIAATSAQRIVDMGAGPGYLIRLIEEVQGIDERVAPEYVLGIEKLENLAQIARETCRAEILTGSYLDLEPIGAFDLIVCNFGFDLVDFNLDGPPPHIGAQIDGHSYCQGCSEFLVPQLLPMLAAWRRWATPDAHLAFTGRFPDPGTLIAFLTAAREANWELDVDRSTFLKVKDPSAESEVFPACLFRKSSGRASSDVQTLAERLYRSRWNG
jgi:SAM-dependent methyltransferase